MNDFVKNHPWLTFFLAIAAIDGAVSLIRGRPSVPARMADAAFAPKLQAPGGLTPPRA